MNGTVVGDATTVGQLRRLLEPFSDDLRISVHAEPFAVLTVRGIFPDYTLTIVGSPTGAQR